MLIEPFQHDKNFLKSIDFVTAKINGNVIPQKDELY